MSGGPAPSTNAKRVASGTVRPDIGAYGALSAWLVTAVAVLIDSLDGFRSPVATMSSTVGHGWVPPASGHGCTMTLPRL